MLIPIQILQRNDYLLILSFTFEFGRCIAKSVSWFRFSITHIPPTLQTSWDSSFYIWIQTLQRKCPFPDCVFYIWIQLLRCNVYFLVSIFTSLSKLLYFTGPASSKWLLGQNLIFRNIFIHRINQIKHHPLYHLNQINQVSDCFVKGNSRSIVLGLRHICRTEW